jgi:cytochrome c553
MRIQQLMAALALLTAPALVSAQAPSAQQVRGWAAACANCHGTQGQALAPMQTLAGLPQEVMVQRMQDFKTGKVPSATIMHQLAKGYSDEQIVAIAAYFAAQKR